MAYGDFDSGHLEAIIFHLKEININLLLASMPTRDIEKNSIFLSNFRYTEIGETKKIENINPKIVNNKKCKSNKKIESNIDSMDISELKLYWSGFIWGENKIERKPIFCLCIQNKGSPPYIQQIKLSGVFNNLQIDESKIFEILNQYVRKSSNLFDHLLMIDSFDLTITQAEDYYLAIVPIQLPIILLDKDPRLPKKFIVSRFHLRVNKIDRSVGLFPFSFNLRVVNGDQESFDNYQRLLYPSQGLLSFLELYPYGVGYYKSDLLFLVVKNIYYNYLQEFDNSILRKYILLSISTYIEENFPLKDYRGYLTETKELTDLEKKFNRTDISDPTNSDMKIKFQEDMPMQNVIKNMQDVVDILKEEIDKLG